MVIPCLYLLLLTVLRTLAAGPPVNKKRTRTLSHKESGSSTNCMVDGTGLEQQRSRPPPAAETGRRGWGRVLIFQGPAKGLRKNQQTQLVKAAHLSYSFRRNVYQESSACRSTICTASVGRYRTRTGRLCAFQPANFTLSGVFFPWQV